MPNTNRLIQEWLPIREIGVESRRERGASSALPPLYFLHVWWARRPLTASRAAILGTLLPAWEGNESLLRRHFPDEEAYHAWFKRMLGIPVHRAGINPVATAAAIARARSTGENLGADPYGYRRAFTAGPDLTEIARLRTLVRDDSTALDSMAGGGSIPFESLRLGIPTTANELNPVASVILRATIEFPLRYGAPLVADIERWADRWGSLIEERLAGLYPLPRGEKAIGYLWARTVPDPSTGKPVPLSPNWWLRRQGDDSVAVKLLANVADFQELERLRTRPTGVRVDLPENGPPGEWPQCRFAIVSGPLGRLRDLIAPDQGTVKRGVAVSPWTGDPIPGDYIKSIAQEGRMGAQLYALCVDRGAGREFRLPNAGDLEGVRLAGEALRANWERWLEAGLIPMETVPDGNKTSEPLRYGMDHWHKMFAPRQLLALCTYLEALRELAPELERELGAEKAAAVRTYLAFVLDKAANYNSMLCNWHPLRNQIANTFDRHDFSFKWSHAEMNMALKEHGGFPWALEQVVDAYEGLCKLLEPAQPLFPREAWRSERPPATVLLANAAALRDLKDASVDAVVVDPPYGNNVMYAELSDFFYVWLKRSVGDLYPDWFRSELVDKDAEAVANPARFKNARGNAKELATRDYLAKMRRVFREMRRVVKPDGAMTVMFTHRETEMWNALGLALLETGWEVGSSWPVHTESEHSLHQAKKNAARSTVLLFCRPRQQAATQAFWDQELQGLVRRTARERAQDYQAAGIDGVDLYLATFGPVLGELSKRWPVLSAEADPETGQPRQLEPEHALRVAREEVFALRRERLVRGRAAVWDAATQWYVLAWDAFRTREFPFDEARKLALAAGLDAGDLTSRHRLLRKKGDTVVFLQPRERSGQNHVNGAATVFPRMVDAFHTAMYLYERDGDRESRRFLEAAGLLRDQAFRTLVEACIGAIPRTRRFERGAVAGFLVPEAETLERMRVTFFPDIEPPSETAQGAGEQAEMELPDEDEGEEDDE